MLAVLRLPGVLPLFVAGAVARLPMGALGLLLILRTHQATGSFASGGLVAGAYTLGLGLSNPALARAVDRRGQTLVLRIGAPVCAAAILALALVPSGTPILGLVALAVAAGAAQPPIGACMRALWPVLAPTPDQRHAAFALEGVALELIYICGPVAVVGGIGSWSTTGAMVVCAAALLTGDLLFSTRAPSREWRAPATAERHMAGPLRAPGVRVLIAVFALCGLAVGAVEVGVTAALTPGGHTSLTGPLLGLWGVGSMAGGLAAGRIGAPADAPRRLTLLLAGWGAAHAALALQTGPVTLGVLLLIAGGAIAPTFVCANGMLDALAPAGTLTESFTWTSTGMTAGVAVGAAIAGVIVDGAGASAAFAVLGGGGLLAAALVRAAAPGPLRPAGALVGG